DAVHRHRPGAGDAVADHGRHAAHVRRCAPGVCHLPARHGCRPREHAMKKLPLQRRTLALLAVTLPLLALFVYVVLRSGPMAPVAVTLTSIEQKMLTPALFGVGTVGTRTTTKIGPTV